MEQRLPAGPWHGAATTTLVLRGIAELAARLRLAARPGWRSRLRSWSAVAGGRLREWTFFLLVLGIAAAVPGSGSRRLSWPPRSAPSTSPTRAGRPA